MGTNGRPGSGDRRPDKGLMDIPKLSAQRKEEIRSEILAGIRSWKKEPEEPRRASVGRFGKKGIFGTVGVGLAAALLAVVLVQTDRSEESKTAIVPAVSGETIPPSKNGGPIGGQAGGLDQDPDDINKNADGLPEGVADPRVTLTYGEFLERWREASKIGGETAKLTALRGEGITLSNTVPRLGETSQSFGPSGTGYRYRVWTDNASRIETREDARMREIAFTFAKPKGGEAQNADTAELLRIVTNVLQPELNEADRSELLDALRFRDFDKEIGSRIAESEGLLYTVARESDGLQLAVRFLRTEGQPDGIGQLQDNMLDVLEGRVSETEK